MDRNSAATTADDFLDQALLEEAAKKSGLLWVRADGESQARPLWHAWHDGAVVVVGDGTEQPLHGLTAGARAVVTVRSKDKGGRLTGWDAEVVELAPEGEAWLGAVEELKGKRLNAPDTDTIAERWARECRVLRLQPAGALTERPGAMPDGSHAARPMPTPATTRRPIPAGLPKLLLKRR
ncbi:hypothetical protein ACIG0C_04190 [Kitasatospora aureofaciens]|uniref:Pyridoxamine 5'-phosphate oxidase putative domain-containing protein n=1 Tax=Kitasatospora aureofaciens TaxID=1894 RepID=A0A1E7N5M7_KITAU|nr:hypothetical protein [Kitasatospora aureofaciens]ARF78832.1 hypothetical protein B6264_07795 [Kitasatospora aureofaciens]OEV36006.1 hypothetical protein HS99_0031340 [Kitasatospora aureofaciens]GGU76966.1 hypothetical protein GCM10010502_31060 [Kitasatospora aureofaciens]